MQNILLLSQMYRTQLTSILEGKQPSKTELFPIKTAGPHLGCSWHIQVATKSCFLYLLSQKFVPNDPIEQ